LFFKFDLSSNEKNQSMYSFAATPLDFKDLGDKSALLPCLKEPALYGLHTSSESLDTWCKTSCLFGLPWSDSGQQAIFTFAASSSAAFYSCIMLQNWVSIAAVTLKVFALIELSLQISRAFLAHLKKEGSLGPFACFLPSAML
jgi:hypothetical protein